MDEAVQKRHDHGSMKAMAGDVADEDLLATVGHGDEIEKIPAQAEGHPVLGADAAPVAGRAALGEKQLLYVAGEVDVDFQVAVAGVVHGHLKIG